MEDVQKQIQESIQKILQAVYNFSTGDVEKIFVYCFMGRDALSGDFFFQYENKIIVKKDMPNRIMEEQIFPTDLTVSEGRKIREAFKKANQEFPNEMYLTYDVKSKKMSNQFKYDVEWDEKAKVPTPDQHFEDWMMKVQQEI
jgi:hypothetical protein